MMNRISSFHNYQSVQNDLRRQEGKVHHNQAQLASGKKLLQPSDNPLATHYIQNIGQQSQQLQQYVDAIVLTRSRLEHNEVIMANAEDYVDEGKRTVMEMINGSLSPEDRQAKRREIEELFSNLLTLANTQDESGNYVFSGTKAKVQPFFSDKAGNISYSGDDYQRKMRISNSQEMPINFPGNKLFMEVANPFGDYKPSYQLQEGSELLLERATNSDSEDKAEYKLTFVDMPNEKYGYQLERNGSVVKADEFNPADGIQYGDLSIQVKGQITKGDVIDLKPQKNVSLFETFKEARDLSDGSVSDASNTAELQRVVQEFHAGFIQMNKARSDVGARLSTLDIQEQQHQDFKMTLAKSKSNFEDLDYAAAVIEFNENSRALQASQQAFGKTKDLTLFNYI
ncbi:flagellar hook-associated protein 3 [Vibrio panuliri]|uniref:Flagellar hook-associated protein 3 n=1 Tax=Vibrio panuliri TaxID=1381081 RepID=A0A1Q9HMG7_9VIBR|nr:flagellar hook-associated protein FlgL [Vibrio panuliri]OLQ91898.1 flagellar hook-associated protein 3 [Vibrio panuliri]